MNFEKALKNLKEGRVMYRNKMVLDGEIAWIKLCRGDMLSSAPDHFQIENDKGANDIWTPTNADLFATDWKECEA